MEGLGINLGLLILQILSFAIVFVVLRKWLYTPMVSMLEKRRESIAKGIEDARVAGEARANAEQEAATILADAQSKAAQVVRDASERAEAAAREIKAAAEVDASKVRAAALAEVEVDRDRILGELRGQVAALSIAAAQKLIGETMDEKRQHVLINEFFSGIKAGKVTVLEGATLSGEAAEVTSALPLTESEQYTVKKEIFAILGDQAEVAFRVNPSILGGLVIHAGGKVMDASVAGRLEELRASLS